MGLSRAAILLTAAAMLLTSAPSAFAEATEVRVSRGYSVLYLPQMMMQKHQLIEKQIGKLGLGTSKSFGEFLTAVMSSTTPHSPAPWTLRPSKTSTNSLVKGARQCGGRNLRLNQLDADVPEHHQTEDQVHRRLRARRQDRRRRDQEFVAGRHPADDGGARVRSAEICAAGQPDGQHSLSGCDDSDAEREVGDQRACCVPAVLVYRARQSQHPQRLPTPPTSWGT